MTSLRANWIRFLSLFHKAQLDRDLDDELSAHLEFHVADNLRSGMSLAEARRHALLKLGGLQQTKESYRDVRAFPWLEAIFYDLRFALRTLRKSPAFAIVAILTLALGIGANTAIFSAVNSVLLRSLPFPDSSALVDISGNNRSYDIPFLSLSWPDISDIRAHSSSFSSVAIYQSSTMELTGAGRPERVETCNVSDSFFSTLAIGPFRGRTFTSSDVQPGNHVAILSYSIWRERFGSDDAILDKSIFLDEQRYRIVGVLPFLPPVSFATDSQIFTPLLPAEEDRSARDAAAFSLVGRLKPGVTLARAQSELNPLAARLASAFPDSHSGWSLRVTRLHQLLLGDARLPLAILFAAVAIVLLIACANVSNLFLARNSARSREFAIRYAIGATRAALLRQLGMESLLIALAGALCGFLIAVWAIPVLRSILPPEIPRLDEIRLDRQVVFFTLAVSILAAICSAIAPAFLMSPRNLDASIKDGRTPWNLRSSETLHNLLRRMLVIAEVALSMILLLGATLALRSFDRLVHLDLGFRSDHLLTLHMDFPKFRYANPAQAISFVQRFLEETRALPGVTSASAGLVFPMSDEVAATAFETEATAADTKLGEQGASGNRVAPDFFRTLGISLLAGRDFTAADDTNHSQVFIVNETLARKYFGTVNAVGRRISGRRESGRPVWGEIVGVVSNVRDSNLREDPKPLVYAPFYQTRIATGAYLVLRSTLDPSSISSSVQQRIWAIEPHQPITAVATLDQRISAVNAAPRSQTLLLGAFASLGLLLTLVGVYGVLSSIASLRTREIGIRMALGAAPSGILRLVIAHGALLIASGVAIGTAGGLILTRFLRSILFGVSVTDPLVFAAVAALLFLVGLTACYLPARRATQVDPVTALHYE